MASASTVYTIPCDGGYEGVKRRLGSCVLAFPPPFCPDSRVISYNKQKIRVHNKVEIFGKQLAQHVAEHSAGASAPAPAALHRVLTTEQQERIRQNKAEVRALHIR